MDRHRVLSLTLLALGLWTSGTGCTSPCRRAPTGTPESADALVYSVRGPFEDGDPILVTGDTNPLCVPHYVMLTRQGGPRSDQYMIEFVFGYASKEWDRDRLAVTVVAYDMRGNVIVSGTQRTEDLRNRLPAGLDGNVLVAMYEPSSNPVQVAAKGSIHDVDQIVIKVAAY